MRNFFIPILAVLCLWCSTSLFSQTIDPAFRGEIVDFSQVNDSTYLVEINLADESGIGNGTNIQATGQWVVWYNCRRYVVTNVNCGSCYLFNSNVNIQVVDRHNGGAPGFGFVSVIKETFCGLSAFTSGIQSGLQQCALQYYKNKLQNCLSSGEEVILFNGFPADISGEIAVDTLGIDSMYIWNNGQWVYFWSAGSGFTTTYQYTSNGAEIWATALGITVTKNATTGEFTVAIPSGAEPIKINIPFLNSDAEDGTNHVYLKFDYAGTRTFNTTLAKLKIPYISIMPTTGIQSRSTPFNVSGGGNNTNDKAYGLSAYGGGDGSNLELKITNAPVATSNTLLIDFTAPVSGAASASSGGPAWDGTQFTSAITLGSYDTLITNYGGMYLNVNNSFVLFSYEVYLKLSPGQLVGYFTIVPPVASDFTEEYGDLQAQVTVIADQNYYPDDGQPYTYALADTDLDRIFVSYEANGNGTVPAYPNNGYRVVINGFYKIK